jgi:hypothetical protein
MDELNEKRECDWYDDAVLVQSLLILPPTKILQVNVFVGWGYISPKIYKCWEVNFRDRCKLP